MKLNEIELNEFFLEWLSERHERPVQLLATEDGQLSKFCAWVEGKNLDFGAFTRCDNALRLLTDAMNEQEKSTYAFHLNIIGRGGSYNALFATRDQKCLAAWRAITDESQSELVEQFAEPELDALCQALCDSENQPHQWIDNEEGLQREIREALACERDREIRLYIDGDQWCALRGEDLQVGASCFGDTPMDALRGWLELYGPNGSALKQ